MVHALRLTIVVLCLAGLLTGAGCKADPTTSPGAVAEPAPDAASSKNVTILALDDVLAVGAAIVEGGDQTPLDRVIVPIHSVADRGLEIEYRFEFFDGERRPIDGVARWRSLHIGPRVHVQVEAAAPRTGAADWALTIRPGPQVESSVEQPS